MNCLLVIATLLTFLVPQDQNLPDAFYELPEEVRNKRRNQGLERTARDV